MTGSDAVNERLRALGSAAIENRRVSMAELLRRPELDHQGVLAVADAGGLAAPAVIGDELSALVTERVEIEQKYAGYLQRQERQASQLAKFDDVRLPDDMDYSTVRGLSREVVEKLTHAKPRSLGQASRMSGVTPVAISVLVTHLNLARKRRELEA